MRQILFCLALIATFGLLAQDSTTPKPPGSKKRKKAVRAKRPVAPRVTPAQRAAARAEIEARLRDDLSIENREALEPFYRSLETAPIHILQFGDSHTASDDWVNAMRTPLQTRFGDGGPGFVQAGRPYRGARRYDARGMNSVGWRTQGTLTQRGDPYQGLSGISITTVLPDQTVSFSASGEALGLHFLRQSGGGRIEITADGQLLDTVATDGDTAPGFAQWPLNPGTHEILARTLDHAPVRLYGWTLENPRGATFETLGINGAQAGMMLDWDETLWAAGAAGRKPNLVILAYGTNEANSPRWEREPYLAGLEALFARLRRALPGTPILMVGPPDCGRLRPLAHLDAVVEAQRDFARAKGVAFWDWRSHMGGPGSVKQWVTAGYAQADYIHMTGEGYRLIGETLVNSLLPPQGDKPIEQTRENR